MFGLSALLDHPFVEFRLVGGGKLHLPCGSIPTALEEHPRAGSEGFITTIHMSTPAQTFSWTVEHAAEEVQALLRGGVQKLNKEGCGPEPLPFRPA